MMTDKEAFYFVGNIIRKLGSVKSKALYNEIKEEVDLKQYNISVYALKKVGFIIEKKGVLIWISDKPAKKNEYNPRFDSPVSKRKVKDKWYAILAYNGTVLLIRQVASFNIKSKATNMARDLIGKTYKGRLVTTVVLEGPFKTMTQASKVEVILPPPNV